MLDDNVSDVYWADVAKTFGIFFISLFLNAKTREEILKRLSPFFYNYPAAI